MPRFTTPEDRKKAFAECLMNSPLANEMDGQSLVTGIQILYLKFAFLLEESDQYPPKIIIKEEMAQAVREYFKSSTIRAASNS